MQTQNCAHQIKIVLLRDLPCEGKGSFDDTPGFGYRGFGYNTTAFEYRVWSYDQSAWSEVPCTGRRCKILIMTIRSKDPILSLRAALIEKELGRKDWNLVSRVSLSLNLNIISWLWWCFQDCVGSTYTSVDIWLKLKLKLGLVDCKSSESQFNKNQ